MGDDGFDFRSPVEKRAPKTFQPPPWEREAFEELERKRADETAVELMTAGDVREGPREGTGETSSESAVGDEASASGGVGAAGEGVPESLVLEMLADLAAEEPRATEAYAGVALGTSIFLVALGGVLVIWAAAALLGAKVTGWIGQMTGTGLGLFGLFFFGMGVWLMRRTLRQRGVL